jgi:hypothetical protein
MTEKPPQKGRTSPGDRPFLISHLDLLRLVGSFPAELPRTRALEHRIQIGAGFHDKWYASQGEHWRGWMGHKDAVLRRAGRDPATVPARERWQLNCAPMMFWLAEAAKVPAGILDQAEDAACRAAEGIRKDHASHGKAMRAVLPWPLVEAALAALPPLSVEAVAAAEAAVARAHDKLVAVRGKRYA